MRRLLAGVVLASWLPAAIAAGPAGPPAPGGVPPRFVLPALDGREVALESLRGRLVLLHFWATWCPTCRAEMSLLERAARDHPDDLVVLGINLGEKRARVADYAREAGLTFPILLDG